MAKIVFRQKAINDLSDIWDYTNNIWSEKQADKCYQLIKSACNKISLYPETGKRYSEISSSLLGFKTGINIVFYHRISEVEIEVIRILHEQMDLKHLKNRIKE